MPNDYDVFVSYCPPDVERAKMLADELQRAGFTVFLDKWEIVPGDRIASELDSGIARAKHGLIVVGKQSASDPLAIEQYAALAKRAMDGKLGRLVPVVLDHGVTLPPLLGARASVTFADVFDEDTFRERAAQLAEDLRGTRAHGSADVVLSGAPDDARLHDTPAWTTLRIGTTSTTLVTEDGTTLDAEHDGATGELRAAQWEAERVRRAADRAVRAERSGPSPVPEGERLDLDAANRAVGVALCAAFLPGSVAGVLAASLASVRRSGRVTHLALEFPDDGETDLSDLAWESLILPGEPVPICLDTAVRVYRHLPGLGATAVRSIPGPLRILAVIASPDVGDEELLDYEHELASILDQVASARDKARGHVRILNWGSLRAIHDALREEDFHVLHISCRTAPGLLYLETADGRVDQVHPRRFAEELSFPRNAPPLVVLAGCRTAQTGPAGGSTRLSGFARELIELGVPSVLTMTTDVSDEYATRLLSRTYLELAVHRDGPDVLGAFSAARQLVEHERQASPDDDPAASSAEWPAAALHQRVRHNLLFHPTAGPGHVNPVRPTVLARGIIDLRVGDFVGRRVELRELLRTLTNAGSRARGVLVHGMGGVGKSSLAAQLMRMLSEQTVVVALHGPHTVDQVLKRLTDVLRRKTRGWANADALAGFLDEVADQRLPWRDRLDVLEQCVQPELGRVDLVMLLDDPAGDPLDPGEEPWSSERAAGGDLELDFAQFLSAWLTMTEGTKLVVTARIPFALPGRGWRMVTHHLGPLSFAETRKLIFRLPALDVLAPADQQRAYQAIGGHPRALEYLDALLRGGHQGRALAARRGSGKPFDVIADRLEMALSANGVNVAEWWRNADGDLDIALGETAAIASADVLLDQLLAGLSATFRPAYSLFVAASMYRQPVDETGLRWAAGFGEDIAADPVRLRRLRQAYQALLAAECAGVARTRKELDLPRQEHEQLNRDLSMAVLPPALPWLPEAIARLENLTLLTPAQQPIDGDDSAGGSTPHYLVHRWTAMSLVARVDPDDLVTAHRRAAAYHRWRADVWRSRHYVHLQELEEVRYHSLQAGDHEEALAVTAQMCVLLDLRGSRTWERDLCEQALAQLADGDVRGRVFHHRLSVVAMRQGDYQEAERWQLLAQDLAVAGGDHVAVAAGLQQLGTVAQLCGETAAAEAHYRDAIRAAGAEEIKERLDARIVLAGCYQRLGGTALGRSDEEDAERFSVGALEVAAEIGNEADLATMHRDLAELARAIGEHTAAGDYELSARTAASAHEDVRRLQAAAFLQLGAVCLIRHMFGDAVDRLESAMTFATQAGDLPLQAACVQLQGETQVHLGELAQARVTYQGFIERADELEDRRGLVVAHQQLGRIAMRLGQSKIAIAELDRAMTIARNMPDHVLVAATHLVRGNVLVVDGRSGDAGADFEEGLRLADAIGQEGLAMGCVIQLALVRLRGGDNEAAARLFAEGHGRASALNSRRGMVVCLLAMALVARQNGADRDSVVWNRKALELAEQERNPRLIAECLARWGDVNLDRGAVDDAKDRYLRCLDVLRRVTAPDLRADVLRQLGRCHADSRDHESTAKAVRAAADGFADLAREEDELACVVRLAWALPWSGRHAAARHAMRRAGALASRCPASPPVVVGLILAAEEALASGQEQTATVHAEDAIAAARKIDDRPLLVDALALLGAIARRRSDLGAAREAFETGLAVSTPIDDRMMSLHLHRELGLNTSTAGDEDAARSHYSVSKNMAEGLGEHAAHRAACLMLAEEQVDRDALADALADAEDDFAEMRWLRRLRAVDGETAFTTRVTNYIGPSIDDVVRDLVPAFSGVSGVPAVVNPATAVRIR